MSVGLWHPIMGRAETEIERAEVIMAKIAEARILIVDDVRFVEGVVLFDARGSESDGARVYREERRSRYPEGKVRSCTTQDSLPSSSATMSYR
jgi:hypothetical protein